MCTCDEIGNRKTLKEGGTNVLGAGLRTTNYFKDVPGTGGALGANALNQYGSIERPQTFDVTGKRAHGSATIKVNGPTALTSGDYQPAGTGLYFRKEVANTPTPWQMNDNYEPVQVTQNDTELTPDQGALQHVGPPTFSPSYDADGNLLADGRWSYTWDGENRLIKMETLEWIQPTSSGSYLAGSSWQATRLEFRYDGFSRRISKKTTRLTGNTVASTAMEGYLYDRWNVIMISQLDPVTGAHLARKWSCLWKPDVASLPYARTSWQKAGGVGGLAWLQTGGTQNMSTTYHSYYGQYVLTGNAEIQVPIMDHMGNVRHYIQLKSGTVNQGYGNIGTMIGQVSANLEYDAFGREVRVSSVAVSATSTPPGLVADGLYADALPFHFSTKFTDPESGLNYYGYRFYDARDGRWISRDPIGERGGKNLYGMCYNNALSWYDVLGRDPASDFLDKVAPNRDKADDAAKRDMMDRKGCIGGAAAGCGRVTDGLSEKSTCYATQKEAETALKDLKCECGKPGRMWALRYKSNGRNPVPYGDDAPGVTYPATAGTQDQNGKPGTSAANTGQFDSRVINNGRAQGVNPTGPSQGGKIPYDDVDDSIDDWRKNTKDYDKEQWCVTCPEK